MAEKIATDRVGNPIFVGDTIIYAHSLGRSAGLQFGKVLKIVTTYTPETTHLLKRWNGDVLEDYIDTTPEHTEHKITVWGVRESWNSTIPPKLNIAKGVLEYPDRMVVLSPNQVPNRIALLLSPVTVDSTAYTLGVKEKK
jgi:hypothetical protein